MRPPGKWASAVRLCKSDRPGEDARHRIRQIYIYDRTISGNIVSPTTMPNPNVLSSSSRTLELTQRLSTVGKSRRSALATGAGRRKTLTIPTTAHRTSCISAILFGVDRPRGATSFRREERKLVQTQFACIWAVSHLITPLFLAQVQCFDNEKGGILKTTTCENDRKAV